MIINLETMELKRKTDYFFFRGCMDCLLHVKFAQVLVFCLGFCLTCCLWPSLTSGKREVIDKEGVIFA